MFTHLNVVEPFNIPTVNGIRGRFYVTPEGNKYPSITTILGAGDKPQLTAWRNLLGEKEADKRTKHGADRGTAVHTMIEKYLNNEDHASVIADQKPEFVREFNSMRMLLRRIDNIHVQEAALWSDLLKCAGRVDCIAEYMGKLSIIDFKTASKDRAQSDIEDYFLQATAYALMYGERYDIHIDQIVILMASEKGGIPLTFTQPIDPYISPLIARIKLFHTPLNTR